MKTKFIIIFVTCGSGKEARRIADMLVKKRLVACANIVSGVKSIFWWKGRIDKASETLLILKTLKTNFTKVEREVKRLHSYEIPEIIAMPISAGNKTYLQWIEDSVK